MDPEAAAHSKRACGGAYGLGVDREPASGAAGEIAAALDEICDDRALETPHESRKVAERSREVSKRSPPME